ncbi:MAG TPA: nucleotidyltransferase domain-containing protein [Acidimicrobiales bacterium]
MPAPVADPAGSDPIGPHGVDDLMRSSMQALAAVPGVVGVTLGGSRARGTADAGADVDLGVYYLAGSLDLAALAAAADAVSDHPVELAPPGTWGPWVDGGAWLHVRGTAVDWILRDLDRVDAVWVDCEAGIVRNEIQTGHPLGFWSHAYCGELALGQVLVDPDGALTRRHDEYLMYPDALATTLVRRLWEARFTLEIAAKAARRADAVYVAGCLFRAVGLMAHALHGHARSWVTNEKGLVALTTALPDAPPRFAERAGDAVAALAPDPGALKTALAVTHALLDDVEDAVRPVDPDDRRR